jgi:amino acid transporter
MTTDVAIGGGSPYEVPGPFGAPVPGAEVPASLRADTLNLFDSTAVAVSSVAPAYSLAATMTLLFVAAGVAYAGPAVIIVSFLPVLFIAIAYFHLNRRDPSCGASYSWLSKLIHPGFGWFNGWVQVAAGVLFCISAPVLAGTNTLAFFHSLGWISASSANDLWLTAVVAALWLALITFICVYGIRWTTNFQWVMVIIEYVAVVGFSVAGIIKVLVKHPAGSTGFHLGWLNPLNIHGYEGIAAGAVLGVFFFWGWDTAANLNEESKNSSRIPGQAGIISMFLLLAIFLLNIIAAQMLLPAKQISNQGSNILFYFGEQVGGRWIGYVMIIAVLSSTVGTTQTTLLPSARITLSMARDQVFPKVFGSIQGKFRTPAIGTVILAFLCLFGILLTTGSSSVNHVFGNLINNIGVLIAFYYGVTGITCAWAYRKVAFQRLGFFLTGVLLPFLGGVFLLWVGYQVVKQSGWSASAPVIYTMLAGIPLVIIARYTTKGDFFKQPRVSYDSIEGDESGAPVLAGASR